MPVRDVPVHDVLVRYMLARLRVYQDAMYQDKLDVPVHGGAVPDGRGWGLPRGAHPDPSIGRHLDLRAWGERGVLSAI